MGDDRGSWKINCRPPRSLHSSVPSWEKTFCTCVCLIPWERICAAKDSIDGYINIAKWDDSAAFEAFKNAKARYWAEISGLPCDIPLPNPDIYIEEVDFMNVIDAELVADLYRKPPHAPDKDQDASLPNVPIKPTGWGDPDDDDGRVELTLDAFLRKPPSGAGWAHVDKIATNLWDDNNGGWVDGTVCIGDNTLSDKRRVNVKYSSSPNQCWNNWSCEQGRRNGMKRSGCNSRFSKSRHQVNSMGDNTYERTLRDGKPLSTQQWRPKHPCRQLNCQISTN